MGAGRPRKSVAEKKAAGTYRKDRDATFEIVENKLKESAIKKTDKVIIPKEIKDQGLRKIYQEHYDRLVNYGLLLEADLVEFNLIFLYAQQIQDLNTELNKADITTERGLLRYQTITYTILKLSARLSDIAKRYYISPVARQKMTLDELDIKKKTTENETIIGKLINRTREQ